MVWMLRCFLLILFCFAIYKLFSYYFHSKQKLTRAQKQHKFLMLDDIKDIRKNILFTYNGHLFVGEKYKEIIPTGDKIATILISPEKAATFDTLTEEDTKIIESKIKKSYPDANINWISHKKNY